jgi:hypothetical protein
MTTSVKQLWNQFQEITPAQDKWIYGVSAGIMLIQSITQWSIINTNSEYQNIYYGWYHNTCNQYKTNSSKVFSFYPGNVAAFGPLFISIWAALSFAKQFQWTHPDMIRWIIHGCLYIVLTICVLQLIGNLDLRTTISLCLSFMMYAAVGYWSERAKYNSSMRLMGQAEDMMHEEVVSWQTVRLSLTLIYIFQLIYQYTTICGIPNTDTSWNLFIVIWTCLFPILAWGITWLLVSKKKNQKDQTKNHVSFMKKYATQQRLYLLFYVLFFSIHSNGVAFGAGHQTV